MCSSRRTISNRAGTCRCKPPSRNSPTTLCRKRSTSRTTQLSKTWKTCSSTPTNLAGKGVTVYRDGRPQEPGDDVGVRRRQKSGTVAAPGSIHPRPRPAVTHGCTYKTKTGCGTLYVNINADDVGLCEIFSANGKVRRLPRVEFRGRVAPHFPGPARRRRPEVDFGAAPRHPLPIPTWHEGEMILSCADASPRAAARDARRVRRGDDPTANNSKSNLDLGLCPQCPECGTIWSIRRAARCARPAVFEVRVRANAV